MKKLVAALLGTATLAALLGLYVLPRWRLEASRKAMAPYEQAMATGRWRPWAASVEGRKLYVMERGTGPPVTLILGAVHGDEPLSALLVLRLAEFLNSDVKTTLPRVILVPAVNPDGLAQGRRTNAHAVDLNRNFPTGNWHPDFREKRYFPGISPASEPETRALMRLLDETKPDRIVSIHAPLRVINYDGDARSLAEAMATQNHYPVRSDIGYDTPGSFGTYAGIERRIPTITLELPAESLQEIWPTNRDALLAAIRFGTETRAEPPSHRP